MKLRTIAPVVAALLAPACHHDPYRRLGCAATHPLPPLPPALSGTNGRGVVCEIDDHASAVPACDPIAALFVQKEHPLGPFGVIVQRHSSYASECQGEYDRWGRRTSDLPYVD